jgi:RecB family exonuclease
MNERVYQLYAQAFQVFDKRDENYREMMEKFAELLIKDCATAIAQDQRLNDVRSAANGCMRTIREHFGVEDGKA